MTVNWNEVLFACYFTWCFTLVMVFLINWNNNYYESSNVEEYLKAKYCYSENLTYDDMPRVEKYCDKSSLTELLGEPK